jgi:2-phospho-L-lactate guanylyltransferase
VKNLSQSKSRLSGEINQLERESLSFTLLRRTLQVLKSSAYVDDIVIVGQDAVACSLAEMENVLFIQERGAGLNHALKQATEWSLNQHYSAVLILPADIPFFTQSDIDSIIEMGNEANQVFVISPDREMMGTNALFIKPPGILEYQFGRNSFRRHCQQAQQKGIDKRIFCNQRLGFDVDSPEHYREMVQELTRSELCPKKCVKSPLFPC